MLVPMNDEVAASAREALGRGDLLRAYDLACQGGERDPNLRYLRILALARMGETEEALHFYKAADLFNSGDVDHKALKARLLKDLGFKDSSEERRALAQALEIYSDIFQATGDYYPGINAATLALITGEVELGRATASAVLRIPQVAQPTEYFAAVTKAEASLIMGDVRSARAAVALAAQLPGADAGSRSTTTKQLQRLAKSLGVEEDAVEEIIAPIRPPAVAFFCGQIFISDLEKEKELREAVRIQLTSSDVGFGYGALAAGADILVAEALLERGAELHVILPFAEADFLAASVTIAGPSWAERYSRCKEAATSFAEATTMGYVGDPLQFSHGSTIAMGLAKLRGRYLGAKVLQLAIWNGGPVGEAGTGADVAKWRRCGGITEILPLHGFERPAMVQQQICYNQTRKTRAIIFADMPGFTKIPESLLPTFWEHVMGTASKVLAAYSDELENSNTWGDALYLVFRSTYPAAAAMSELQRELSLIDYGSLGFSSPPTFRIAGHFAPVYVGSDPVTGRMSVYGVEVSKAARIEPVTPPGSIYITASFAAQLEMENPGGFDAIYMGQIPLAKGYGEIPVYRLRSC